MWVSNLILPCNFFLFKIKSDFHYISVKCKSNMTLNNPKQLFQVVNIFQPSSLGVKITKLRLFNLWLKYFLRSQSRSFRLWRPINLGLWRNLQVRKPKNRWLVVHNDRVLRWFFIFVLAAFFHLIFGTFRLLISDCRSKVAFANAWRHALVIRWARPWILVQWCLTSFSIEASEHRLFLIVFLNSLLFKKFLSLNS